MFRLPDCTTALTAANIAFLEDSLTGLQHPLSIIQGPDNGVCQDSVQRALRGEIPVLDAATSLMKAVETKHLDWIQSGLKNLYRPFIHAERSRLWRHVPLPLILGAMQMAFGENAVKPQFVTGAVPLDFIRDLLNDDGWPIAIPSGPPESGEPDDPGYFHVHGPGRDAYWTLLHDVWHALTWCARPLPRRREVVRQHDLFTGVMKRVPDAYHGLMAFNELRDALLGGSLEEERILRFLNTYLETDAREGRIPSDVANRVLTEYGERLRRSAPPGSPPGG